MMKKMRFLFGTIAMVMAFAILFVSCPDEEAEKKSSDATLKTLTVGGASINAFGTPSATVAGITSAPAVNINENNASGVTVAFTVHAKASAVFAIGEHGQTPDASSWKTSGTNTGQLENGKELVIKVTAEDKSILYYAFPINLFNENTDATLATVTIDETAAAPGTPAASPSAATAVNINISTAQAAAGVVVQLTPTSSHATAQFVIASAKDDIILETYKNSGENTGVLTNDPFLIVRVQPQSGSNQFYVYQFKIQGGQVEPGDSLEGKLLILQAYGSADDAEGATHSFVELYNVTDAAINLTGVKLYYANGKRGLNITDDTEWKSIALSGTIPANGSFLILGAYQGSTVARYNIETKHGLNYGDMNVSDFTLGNRSFKAAIIKGDAVLDVPNPFNIDGNGTKIAGYIDMVGSANNPTHATNPDNIFGFEAAPARNSGSEAVRRKDLDDTNNNSVDFVSIRYAIRDNGISDEMLEVRYPRNAKDNPNGWNPFQEPEAPPPPSAKLMILQANSIGNDNGGFGRSVVELYNDTDTAVDLSNYYLHVGDASGWIAPIQLSKSIPSKTSFLIVGDVETGAIPRAPLPEGDLHLNFKFTTGNFSVAVFNNYSETLTGNPFGDTALAEKYIDMLGIGNGPGYETAVAPGSRPQPPRRKNLTDTDDNSRDFEQARFHRTTNPLQDNELYKYWPRNSAAGEWDPMTGLPQIDPPWPIPDGQIVVGDPDALAGELLILQAYGSSSTAAGVSHSFVELYNNSGAAIDLTGISLYYADGTSVSAAPNTNTKDGDWKKIELSGDLPDQASFLITGLKQSSVARLQIAADFADMEESDFILSNRAFKVAIIRSTGTLVAQNPFNMNGTGGKAAGYIDMVGAANAYSADGNDRDRIFGFEGTGASVPRNSASEAVRRESLTDTDDNAADFVSIRYATGTGGLTNEEVDVRRPQNMVNGAWNPFAAPAEPPPLATGTEMLMILQANRRGNDNGVAGGFPKTLVELYNNTNAAIVLDGTTDKYYLHIGTASAWTHVIPLRGTIQSQRSFLIVSSNAGEVNTGGTAATITAPGRAVLPTADQSEDFSFGANNNWKVAIMKNQSTLLTVDNPFGDTSLTANYVDLLGVGTANACEGGTAGAAGSQPQGPRRKSLVDTNVNSDDFVQVDYRGLWNNDGTLGTARMPNTDLHKYWPRNHSAGVWNPITGLPFVHPTVINPVTGVIEFPAP